MRKSHRVRFAVGVLLTAIVGVLAFALLSRSPPEPVFQGKTLTTWIEDYFKVRYRHSYDPTVGKKTEAAVREIGTNALPALLRLIRAQDPPPMMLNLMDLASRQSLVKIRYRSARGRHDQADYAFSILGTNAAPAVPELIKICEAQRYPTSQEYAAQALGYIGPAAQAAIPVLLRNFANTNAEVRRAMVAATYSIGGDPITLVPAMKKMLNDPDRDVRYIAIGALERERSAIPELLGALRDNDPGVKEAAESALWNLAPEKVAKPLVVEDATPMVNNGITTEALSRESHGDLWILIPQDKRVRCVVYQSVLPPLHLYRGLTKTTTNDHFLGRFEAVFPASETNVSVEVAYIIDHQQILLCARDSIRKQFVELRRVEEEAAK